METPTKKSDLVRTSIADLQVGDLVKQEPDGRKTLLVTDVKSLAAIDDNGEEIFSLGVRVTFLEIKTKRYYEQNYTKGPHIHQHYFLISRAE
jgi:hypothetical protein